MKKIQLPPRRSFPPGHLEARRDHLVREARAEVKPANRFRLLSLLTARRAIAFGVVLVAIGAGAFVSIGQLSSGTELAAAAVKINFSPAVPGSTAASGAPGQVVVNVVKAMRLRSERRQDVLVSGGTLDQQALLRQILSGMPENSIADVTIAPKQYMGTAGVGLEFTALPGDLPRSEWEEMLVAGAFRALSAERGLTPVVGLPPQYSDYSPSTETPADVETTIRQAASAAGADVVQLQVYQVYGVEPAVILQVDDPAAFLENDLPGFLDAIHTTHDYSHSYGAVYIEVIDKTGAFVWCWGSNSIAPSGLEGARPDLAGCSPIQTLMGETTPCP